MKVILASLLALTTTVGAEQIPNQYCDLYRTLDAKLAEAERVVGRPDPKSQPVFAAELTAANGNRGPTLLEERTRVGVSKNLDAFKALGVSGIVVASVYPMFVKDFPHAAEYLDFYKFVMTEARRRNLKVLFKIGEAFRDPVHGQLPVDNWYRGLTLDRFRREKRTMIETALRELQPDYLTVANEPDTSAMNTKLDFSTENYIRSVQAFTRGLARGQTKIGAGAGTWSQTVYFERLARETDVDYLDLHIYPINHDYLTKRALEAAALARRHGKSLVIGEGWLFKSRDRELGPGGLGYVKLYARDAFSFWQPLDARLIRVLAQFSRAQRVEFMSLFWVNLLFGSLEYSPELDAKSPGEIQALAARAAVPNILAGKLSPTGEAYRSMITAR
jgi:hypothetical protein